MVLNSKPKLTEDGVIMEFATDDERDSELLRVALFCYINARVEDLPDNTRITVERDGLDVRVIANKGRDEVRHVVRKCLRLLYDEPDNGKE